MKINHCLRCDHQWPSKLERAFTCSKCRSPYWDVPRQTDAIDDGSYAPSGAFSEKNSPEASPVIDKKTELDGLRAIMEAVQIKPKAEPHPALPVYPVEDQPAFNEGKYLQYD